MTINDIIENESYSFKYKALFTLYNIVGFKANNIDEINMLFSKLSECNIQVKNINSWSNADIRNIDFDKELFGIFFVDGDKNSSTVFCGIQDYKFASTSKIYTASELYGSSKLELI